MSQGVTLLTSKSNSQGIILTLCFSVSSMSCWASKHTLCHDLTSFSNSSQNSFLQSEILAHTNMISRRKLIFGIIDLTGKEKIVVGYMRNYQYPS